ncbi:MAG: hypothetical protein K8R63_13550 [Bacteroidales bacterium]|nr:hypothetical protein [Bacteroidales bacterium]
MATEITLKPGTIDDFNGSMAKAMEDAFKAIWPVIMATDEPKTSKHLRMMFIAISQGVVKHLSDKAEAVKVTVKPERSSSGGDDPSALHKHKIAKSEELSDGTNWWEVIIDHTHPVKETDTHDHVSEVTIDTDSTLIL